MDAAGLREVAGVEGAFHPPVPNNYVHLLVPRHRDMGEVVRAIAEATAPLNRADEALLGCCAELLAGHHDPLGEQALEGWRGCIRRRVNLQGIRWASEVAARLGAGERGAISLPERLHREHPEVLASFRSVPRSLLELVRINGYLRPEQLVGVLGRITADLRDPTLAAAVERIEVARLARGIEPGAIDHPTLIVYLRAEVMTDESLAAAIEHLVERFAAVGPALTPRAQYALPLAHDATLTQGYFLYKRYLQLVGLLDELYDPAWGHALTRPTFGGIERVLRGPRLRQSARAARDM